MILKRRRTRLITGVVLLLVVVGVVATGFLLRPTIFLLRVASRDVDERDVVPAGSVDDASRLNQTPIAEHWPVPDDPAKARDELATLVRRARDQSLKISIAGSRHSMGGHTIAEDGITINMLPFDHMTLDTSSDILTVGAGATWEQVIAYLDAKGRSVGVMQSNNSFSIGGSISVNCHGWQHDHGPIASTVEAFNIMDASGTVLRCSRHENAELFSLALGGYGLFGVILDVDLRVVPNERYRIEQTIVVIDDYMDTYERRVRQTPDAAMAYGRLSIDPDSLLDEGVLNVLRRAPAADGSIPPLEAPPMLGLSRTVFRASEGSDYGKSLRWKLERDLQRQLQDGVFSRNQLLNQGVEIYENRSWATTDILHEYFVPEDQFAAFVHRLRAIVRSHDVDLLNVTVRNVQRDLDSYLHYASEDVVSFVLLLTQKRTPNGEAAMVAFTRDAIEASLEVGGRYYLPYRLHATQDQFDRAYPMARDFFALKRKYDPTGLWSNRFYETYGRP